MNRLLVLAAEGAAERGWTARDVGGLIFVGVLVLVIWLAFRRMQFPEHWERKDDDPPPGPPKA